MAIVDIQKLHFHYHAGAQTIPILRDVNLAINEGEMVAIIGPSGSGKSTLLHIIGCLLAPQQGRALIQGKNLSKCSEEELAYLRSQFIGFVFQQFHLIPKTDVTQNVLLPTSYPIERRRMVDCSQKAAELIAKLGLSSYTTQHPNQLSGGQQQRVAIARALIKDPPLILADEPTGSLDSATAKEILNLLKNLHSDGKTVVIITHDQEVAAQCHRTITLKDGRIVKDSGFSIEGKTLSQSIHATIQHPSNMMTQWARMLPLAFFNLKRNKLRSFLTMIGITIGIAAVFSMMTMGQYTKESLLKSYEELGVNRLSFRGYPNWKLKATDDVPLMFRGFDTQSDLHNLRQIFPEIRLISPVLWSWQVKAGFGGLEMDSTSVIGVDYAYLDITNRSLFSGQVLTPYHIENKSGVCLIGFEVSRRLFRGRNPIGEILTLSSNDKNYGCRILGTLKSQSSNSSWNKPDEQILLPYTYFQVNTNFWESRISSVMMQIHSGHDIELVGKRIKAFFERKYGPSGRFWVGANDVLVSQVKKFLTLFSVLLASIAAISLLVGGIGIANMMLVSVSERFREIGLRKAVGATAVSIRRQFLLESTTLCCNSGAIGLVLGFITYQAIIFAAANLLDRMEFAWIIDPVATVVSLVAIITVGIASGIVPAIKAEKLQVIEALRSE